MMNTPPSKTGPMDSENPCQGLTRFSLDEGIAAAG
jgi:hypothetical protein